MTTTLTLGPLVTPLTREEQQRCALFAKTTRERGGELWVVEDHVLGTVSAWATIPGPADVPATEGASS